MKNFEFTLGRILDYRQSLLEKEKNALMQLFAQKNAIEDQIEHLWRVYNETAKELQETTEAGTTIAEIQRIDLRLQSAKRRIETLEQERMQLEELIEAQREVVTELSQQVTGLEKLRDKQREDYDYASRQEETERIAELISSKIARGEDNAF